MHPEHLSHKSFTHIPLFEAHGAGKSNMDTSKNTGIVVPRAVMTLGQNKHVAKKKKIYIFVTALLPLLVYPAVITDLTFEISRFPMKHLVMSNATQRRMKCSYERHRGWQLTVASHLTVQQFYTYCPATVLYILRKGSKVGLEPCVGSLTAEPMVQAVLCAFIKGSLEAHFRQQKEKNEMPTCCANFNRFWAQHQLLARIQ